MSYKIDKKTEYHLIKRFSKEWDNVQEPTKTQIMSIFDNEQSIDYYYGVLSAFSSALSYEQDFQPSLNKEQMIQVLSALVAYSSKILIDRVSEDESAKD